MPCWNVVRASIELRAENIDLLKRALEADTEVDEVTKTARGLTYYNRAAGETVTVDRRGDKLVVRGYDVDTQVANGINRSYSKQVITESAARQGFTLKQKGENKFVAVKALGGGSLALLLALVGDAGAHHEEVMAAAPFVGMWLSYTVAMLGASVVAVRRLVRRQR